MGWILNGAQDSVVNSKKKSELIGYDFNFINYTIGSLLHEGQGWGGGEVGMVEK